MIKAIFMDYTGTMVMEDEPNTRELLKYFIAHSDVKDPKEVLRIVWSKVKEIEAESYGENFAGNDVRVDKILKYCTENCGLKGDLDLMHEIWRRIWVHAPLFDDVKPFFERAALPVYVISNDDLCYLEESFRLKGIRPTGIISAETVRACKPHRAIFEEALRTAGVRHDEAVHIGDSVTSDVEGAKAVGITPIYLSRNGNADIQGVTVINSLDEYVF
ncbi:putative hydrolase of the HAD superfamily [Ruminococcus sp. YE71]|uniref:HAD family hydrolase n=1 Tax=unclassified Ruminococcus TaxID=2608920 RepID=UPI00087FD376|nr:MULTISPECIES: HAD family hydrolase [unclassified Ruminococcus]SDA21875.1 putative hydrolase of the HAD superfamily [Ruminococcus sp. YE78]SFW37047.1 putative hydrolase of the HAD superfamily [Ruminococcus sp. YE71]